MSGTHRFGPLRACCGGLILCGLLFWSGSARAEKAILADGRVLEGRFVRITGVAANPQTSNDLVKSIFLSDDDLTRTMVSWRRVEKLISAAPPRIEHFTIPQPIAENGAPVASLGTIVQVTPWDSFGRRIFSMAVKGARIDVIQGLTEITPHWSRIESLRQDGTNYLWDMRIATSSIPRDTLNAILLRQIDPKNPDQRLKLVRFYMQAERFQDAEAELQGVIKDFKTFPNMPALGDESKLLIKFGAERLLHEAEVRAMAGQHRLAYRMLDRFPTKDVNGTVLEEVRDKLEQYNKLQKRMVSIVAQLDRQIAKVKDKEIVKQIKPIRDEIARELFVATLDRLAPFARLSDDPAMLPEQKLALAISGWLLGPNDAIDNIQTALSLVNTRNTIRKYLAEPLKINRDPLLESLGSQQGASPKYVAELLAHMKPPIATPAQQKPGFFKLEIHGIANEPDVAYYVQLPPEYDPYRKYPTIVTLNAAGTTPEMQIDWWAGIAREAARKAAPPKPAAGAKPPAPAAPGQPATRGAVIEPGMRLGQAARQGYIVIAPAWTRPHQMQYEYSAREHAAVLGSLRDACKRFSIDTDRVFLSGHSMGGDAAWDIALAHPDLWAGVIPIVATSGKYVERYWQNAAKVPMYFVSGELDGNKTEINAPQWDKYFRTPGFDMTLVEYQGRGHENFSDEILRIFEWMGHKKRDFFPRSFHVVTMRTWDNFFWCVELSNLPSRQMVDPSSWPPPRGTQPLNLEVHTTAANANGIDVSMHAAKVTVWLSPEWVSFDRPISVTINDNRVAAGKGAIKPSIAVILEDARTRGDRQHPFWAKVQALKRDVFCRDAGLRRA